MDVLATKTFGEVEDEEAERLVRPLPKKKPPRRDRRREEMQTERDPDVEGDSDLKGDPDLSLNYKSVGGSMPRRVARRFLGQEDRTISVRRRDTGRVVQVSEETLKEEGSKYEKLEEEERGEGGSKGDALRDLAKDKPQLQSVLKDLMNPRSDLGGLAEGNPNLPASTVVKGVPLPEGIKTLGDLVKALRAKPSKPKPKSKTPSAPTPPQAPSEAPTPPQAPSEAPTPPQAPSEAPQAPSEAPQAPSEAPQAPSEAPTPPQAPSPEGKKPKSKPKPEPEEKPEEKPKSAVDFPPPQRKPPTEQEILEAMDLVHSTNLPPGIRAKLLVLHPADVKEVLASYNGFNSLEDPKDFKEELEAAGRNFTLDPSKVTSLPTKVTNAKGEKKPFESLSETEQAQAVQAHRNAVVAASLASQMRVVRSMVSSGIPEYLAAKLSYFSLSTANYPPEVRERKAHEAALSTFTEAVTGFSGKAEEEDERFGSFIQKIRRKLFGDDERRKYLKAIEKLDPHTQMAAVAHLQGEDYRSISSRFLNSDSRDRISEFDSPQKISRKLSLALDAFRKASRQYPSEVRAALPDPSRVFRIVVRQSLRELDPEKAKAVSRVMLEVDADAYDKAMIEYKEEEKLFQKAYKEYEREYQLWEKAKKKYEAQQLKGSPYRVVTEPFNQSPPELPLSPELPVKPIGYETVRKTSKKDREEIQDKLDELRGGKTASLYSSYARRKQMTSAIAPYPKWQQAHQRDLGAKDFDVILKAAKDWLKSPMLSTHIEGMVPDARFRASLDLAIQTSEDGKYANALSPVLYNMLLAKLSNQPEGETLLTVRKAQSELKLGTAEGNAMTIKFAKAHANNILARLDKIAAEIQDKYAQWGMDFDDAKRMVNDLDQAADAIEKAAFGEESFRARQIEVLKSAKVIQQDSDEGYMGTFNAPTAPHQSDSDEEYMSLYKDDQTQGVQSGKSSTGRPLAP